PERRPADRDPLRRAQHRRRPRRRVRDSAAADGAMTIAATPLRRRRRLSLALRFRRDGAARVGLGLAVLVLALALIGPFFAPYSPSGIVGVPFAHPDGKFLLGIDFNGRDVLSRVLWGGRT